MFAWCHGRNPGWHQAPARLCKALEATVFPPSGQGSPRKSSLAVREQQLKSLWGARGNHHPCKNQVSSTSYPASPWGKIHLAKIHTAGSQEQHENPPANINQVIYLLASGFKRQGKKDVKNMINLTWPKQ